MAAAPELLFPEPMFMTVEQYRQLPEQPGVTQELHWGQLINLSFPKKIHSDIQDRLVDLLRQRAGNLGRIRAEFPFRALPEYDLRGADVAFVSQARWDNTDDDDNLHGSPELVIEVLSRSNTPAEMREKALSVLPPEPKSSGSSIPTSKPSLSCVAEPNPASIQPTSRSR